MKPPRLRPLSEPSLYSQPSSTMKHLAENAGSHTGLCGTPRGRPRRYPRYLGSPEGNLGFQEAFQGLWTPVPYVS